MRAAVGFSPFSALIAAGLPLLFQGCASGVRKTSVPPVDLEPVEARPALPPSAAADRITAAAMREHIAFLASDELRGRDTPSPGLERAAEYVAAAFRRAGLEPGGNGGSYFQRYDYVRRSLRTAELELRIAAQGEELTFAYGTDYFLIATRPDTITAEGRLLGTLASVSGGVPADVAGRVAFLLMPPHLGFDIIPVLRAVGEAGAAAVGLILPPEIPREVIGGIADQVESGLPVSLKAPAFGLHYEAAVRMLAAAGLDLDALREKAASGELESVEMAGTPILLRVAIREENSRPANVVGVLRGGDPALEDSYVVLTAHYDHVGVGAPDASGDSIYNGADDDASGTALLLEVAKAFHTLGHVPARSVVFLAVSGEEKGLLGSLHWVREPTVALDGVIADLNFDMIGRNSPDTLIAVGQELTSLGALARKIAAQHPDLGLVLAPDPDPSEQAFLRSDQVAFVRREIPALFLTTWLHPDYHKPSDEVDRIDAAKAARVARLAFYIALAVADDSVPPAWTPGSLEEVRRILEGSPF